MGNENLMLQHESKHYIFNFYAGSKAAEDILLIAEHQQACYTHICKVLGVEPKFKIKYFLCNSPEEVGKIYGDNEPCNAFTSPPDSIYAVYNDDIQCIGFHEDAHIISYTINRPESAAIREGLAMYFDRVWWGISNEDWTLYYLKTNKYISICNLLDNKYFFSEDCSLTYPIMGAFTNYLIVHYGIKKYLVFYRYKDNIFDGFEKVYKLSVNELEMKFKKEIAKLELTNDTESKIKQLLMKNKT
ncbi:MAG TPA: hypothetical protein PLV28_04675 [Bacilli bacterium]|jgi:hypothetical protein|nr:hypothetical protein [Bacilli bacterium]